MGFYKVERRDEMILTCFARARADPELLSIPFKVVLGFDF